MPKKIQNSAIYLLSFISSFLIFALSVCLIIQFTFGNTTFIEKQASHANFYQLTRNEIIEKMTHYGRSGNISQKNIQAAVTIKQVTSDVKQAFQSEMHGELYEADTTVMKQNLKNTLQQQAKKQHIKIDEATEKNINQYLAASEEIYQTQITVPYLNVVGQKYMILKPFLQTSMLLLTISMIVMIYFLFHLLKWGHLLLRYLAYSFLGAGLMLSILPSGVLLSGKIKQLSILSKSLYYFVTTYLQQFFFTFIFTGFLVILIGIFLAILSEKMRHELVTK